MNIIQFLKQRIEIVEYQRAPLKGSNGLYDHIATMSLKDKGIERFFVCFVEAGKILDALYSSAHIKNSAHKALKDKLVETGKVKPAIFIEEVLFVPKNQDMSTWLKQVENEDLWKALFEKIIEHSKALNMQNFQILADKK